MALLWLSVLLLAPVVKAQQHFREFAPPAFHAGSVFHGNSEAFDEPNYQALGLSEFSAMTSTVYLPWGGWDSPDETTPDTSFFAKVVDSLRQKNLVVHGHALLYPSANLESDWWRAQANSLVEGRMNTYIDSLAGVRKGQVWTWDVVNEVMGDTGDDNDQDGVRKTLYDGRPIKEYQAMGQDYIAKAFYRARAADPDAILLFTDYGAEQDDPSNDDEKSDRLYRFVKKLRERGVPVDGVGFQMHVSSLSGRTPNYKEIALNFERFRKLGLRIFITEMDVTSIESKEPGNVASATLGVAAEKQAEVFKQIMSVCLAEPACEALMFWDFAEYNSRVPSLRYSWLHPITYDPNLLGVYTFPTPFWDINPESFQPKLGWMEMKATMEQFSISGDATYRLISMWKPESGYLIRDGSCTIGKMYVPSNTVALDALNGASDSWLSMKWALERTTSNVYRIASTWGETSMYLSRGGVPDGSGGYTPGTDVYLDSLHESWTSQLWTLEHVYNDVYRLRNNWSGGGSDYLSRMGAPNADGSFSASSTVYLDALNQDWTSQQWALRKVYDSRAGCESLPCSQVKKCSNTPLLCFPAEATVEVQGRGVVKMTDLALGEMVKVNDAGKFEPVYAFGHHSENAMGMYVSISLLGKHPEPLVISPDHMVAVRLLDASRTHIQMIPASLVVVGDEIALGAGGFGVVGIISKANRRGAYAPFTKSGTIVVNGMVASNYVTLQRDSSELILTGGVRTGFSMHWLAHVSCAPYRLACEFVFASYCKGNSTYNRDGLSHWVALPLRLSVWVLEQRTVVVMLTAVPVFIILGAFAVLEATGPLWPLVAALAFLFSIKKNITFRDYRSKIQR